MGYFIPAGRTLETLGAQKTFTLAPIIQKRLCIYIYQQSIKEQLMTQCTFCGCLHYEDNPQSVYIALIFICLIILYIMYAVKLGLDWFIFKDYYPLKEKSPILTILLLICISVQILHYPILFIYNYFTIAFDQNGATKTLYRVVSGATWGIPYFIYFLKSMRLVYAHETHSSRSKSLPFLIFKKQVLLSSFVCFWMILKGLVIGFRSDNFHLIYEKDYQNEDAAIYVNVIWDFIWEVVLIYCLWLQKSVNKRYSIKMELMMIIFTLFFISGLVISLLIKGYHEDSILITLCIDRLNYPPLILTQCFTLFIMLGVSIIWPLSMKKVYHKLLPTGRHYGFVKTMRDFLLENQFRTVFTKYLEHMDQRQGTDKRMTLMKFWCQLITLKLNRRESEKQKISSIRTLIEEVENVLFENERNIISNLKDSIVSLEASINNSEVLKEKYRESINEKVDELQKIALERLDKIYSNEYRRTESYYELKEITKQNKKINLNMILLQMALIVDSENQFV